MTCWRRLARITLVAAITAGFDPDGTAGARTADWMRGKCRRDGFGWVQLSGSEGWPKECSDLHWVSLLPGRNRLILVGTERASGRDRWSDQDVGTGRLRVVSLGDLKGDPAGCVTLPWTYRQSKVRSCWIGDLYVRIALEAEPQGIVKSTAGPIQKVPEQHVVLFNPWNYELLDAESDTQTQLEKSDLGLHVGAQEEEKTFQCPVPELPEMTRWEDWPEAQAEMVELSVACRGSGWESAKVLDDGGRKLMVVGRAAADSAELLPYRLCFVTAENGTYQLALKVESFHRIDVRGVLAGEDGETFWLVSMNGGLLSDIARSFLHRGGRDLLVLRMDAPGKVMWSSVFGGVGWEELYSAWLVGERLVLLGETDSPDLLLRQPEISKLKGGVDLFLAEFDVRSGRLVRGTYLGGAGIEELAAASMDEHGMVWFLAWVGAPLSNWQLDEVREGRLEGASSLYLGCARAGGAWDDREENTPAPVANRR